MIRVRFPHPPFSLPAVSVFYSWGLDCISHLTSSLPLDPSKVHSLSSFMSSKPNVRVAVYTTAPLCPTTTSINKSNRGQRASLWEPFTVYLILFQSFSCITSICNCDCVYYRNTESLFRYVLASKHIHLCT